MLRLNNKFTLAVGSLAALAMLAVTHTARAASWESCGSTDIKLTSGTKAFYRHSPTLPDGSNEANAYLNGIDSWNAVGGMSNKLSNNLATKTSAPAWPNGDFEAALVSRSSIDGKSGLTHVIYNFPYPVCAPLITERILEADVMVASDLPFANPEESALVDNGPDVFLHEFGHVLGLQHYQNFNIMRTAANRPHFGGPGQHVDVLPDDAKGGRGLYGVSGSHTNVFSTAFRRESATDVISQNVSGSMNSCVGGGGQFSIMQTVGNNGTVDIQQTERWFISTNPVAYSNGFLFAQWNNSTYLKDGALTLWRTFTMPSLPPGTYRIFHGVDMLNQHSELREDDNVVREALVVFVVTC